MIEVPAQRYYDDLCRAFRGLKKGPFELCFNLRCLSLDGFKILREHILAENPGAGMAPPRKVAGMRGGRVHKWTILIEDTASFVAIVGKYFPHPAVSQWAGTGCLFETEVFTAWLPPLEMTLTAADATGESNSSCRVRMSSARMTPHGFDFTRRTKKHFEKHPGDIPINYRYLALGVLSVQAARAANQGAPDALPLVELPLLQKAAQHAHVVAQGGPW